MTRITLQNLTVNRTMDSTEMQSTQGGLFGFRFGFGLRIPIFRPRFPIFRHRIWW